MSKKVKIILLEDVVNLGRAGDIVTVAEGYARNMLIPQTKAALATAQSEQSITAAKANEAKIAADRLAAQQAQAETLTGTELVITARIKDGTDIYGQIKPAQIAKLLHQQAKLKLTARHISLPAPIKTTGTYDVTVSLSPDVETSIRVTVVPDPSRQPSRTAEAE